MAANQQFSVSLREAPENFTNGMRMRPGMTDWNKLREELNFIYSANFYWPPTMCQALY